VDWLTCCGAWWGVVGFGVVCAEWVEVLVGVSSVDIDL